MNEIIEFDRIFNRCLNRAEHGPRPGSDWAVGALSINAADAHAIEVALALPVRNAAILAENVPFSEFTSAVGLIAGVRKTIQVGMQRDEKGNGAVYYPPANKIIQGETDPVNIALIANAVTTGNIFLEQAALLEDLGTQVGRQVRVVAGVCMIETFHTADDPYPAMRRIKERGGPEGLGGTSFTSLVRFDGSRFIPSPTAPRITVDFVNAVVASIASATAGAIARADLNAALRARDDLINPRLPGFEEEADGKVREHHRARGPLRPSIISRDIRACEPLDP